MKRRDFLTNIGAAALGLTLLETAKAGEFLNSATATGRVVVVGGGMAGTSVAKYLRL